MIKRRDLLKIGVATAAGSGLFIAAKKVSDTPENKNQEMRKYLCMPDGIPPPLEVSPSPKAERYKAELFIPETIKSQPSLNPKPDPKAHQLYDKYPPKHFFELHEEELLWQYHPDPPYKDRSWSWGFNGTTPGPTFHARYGEPVLVRRFNDLPPVGVSNVTWALPSTTTHLHNGHTASESDGNPQDWIDPGEFWDHHYGNFPSGNNPDEKLTTLWYHDHRLDFTAANVYAGLAGFYFLFDEYDTGNEKDNTPTAWKLPSGDFDIPLLIHDVLFDENGQVVFNGFMTDGWLGDQITINRRIRPFLEVEPRKYRFRILNGGPSRFYQLFLKNLDDPDTPIDFCVITGDGNVLPAPLEARSIYLSVAQRVDVIIDFSKYKGQHIVIENHLEQTNGKGPSGRMLEEPDGIIQFKVTKPLREPDQSRIPKKLRDLPKQKPIVRERTWTFDYDGGLWTINGRIMDPNRIDAGIEQGTAEIWTFRNAGNDWSHPIHSHFTEFIILEVNGKPYKPTYVTSLDGDEYSYREYWDMPPEDRKPVQVFMGGPRRDVATILPGDEIKVVMSWNDFLGKHVMHCHNVVHEDHAMMIRWDIMPPGQGFDGPRMASDVYGEAPIPPHVEARPGQATFQDGAEN